MSSRFKEQSPIQGKMLMSLYCSGNILDTVLTNYALSTGEFSEVNQFANQLFESGKQAEVLTLKLAAIVVIIALYALLKTSSSSEKFNKGWVADRTILFGNALVWSIVCLNALQIVLYHGQS